MTKSILTEIRFAEFRHLDSPPTGERRSIFRKSVLSLLGLALLTTCIAIVDQTEEIGKLLGLDSWTAGMAVVAVWVWACLWFVYRENGRAGV
jgi:hypothetical protein